MDEITDRKIREYAGLVRRALPVSAIVLYGSYARGEEGRDSDIDIAVVVDELREDFLDVNARLFALCREVDVAIEPKLIVKKNNTSGFLESILKYGKVIHPE
ncbi:MAG: nucleotidyltransferase domain-containing protein [Spirochaetes bacterium]|jgi:predicted nucleotidyltransferase|nr:nucleotidyltransferase domain-containing protein [Spirochaetota bacterium]